MHHRFLEELSEGHGRDSGPGASQRWLSTYWCRSRFCYCIDLQWRGLVPTKDKKGSDFNVCRRF